MDQHWAREQSRFTTRQVRRRKDLVEQGAGLLGGPIEAGYYPGRPANRYFESGFPRTNHPFISYAAACWATSALIMAAAAD